MPSHKKIETESEDENTSSGVEEEKLQTLVEMFDKTKSAKLMNYINTPYNIYFMTVQQLFTRDDIDNWSYQRKKDIKQLEKLRDALTKKGRLLGPFSFAFNRTANKLLLIDGQHRHEVILEYLRSNPKFDMDIQVNIFEVEDDSKILELFKDINNVSSLSDEERAIEEYVTLIDYLQKQFPKAFKDTVKSSVPYITKRRLQKFMKKQKYKVDVNVWYNAIITYNNEYAASITAKLYTEAHATKYERYKKKRALNKKQKHIDYLQKYKVYHACKTSSFYLGMFDKFEWIVEINKRLSATAITTV